MRKCANKQSLIHILHSEGNSNLSVECVKKLLDITKLNTLKLTNICNLSGSIIQSQ